PEPEGLRLWEKHTTPAEGAALVRLAWWTDGLTRRHFRVSACHGTPADLSAWQSPEDDISTLLYPQQGYPLIHISPERVYLRRDLKFAALLAVCPCGACDTPAALGWMGPCCRVCFERQMQGIPVPQTGRTILQSHAGPVRALAFAPDGRTLASAGGWGG